MNKRNNYKIKLSKQYKQFFNIIAVSLIIGLIAGVSVNYNNIKPLITNNEINESPNYDPALVNRGEISLCFTPPSGCAKVISNLISKAKESVYVQAYGITSNEIVDELLAAHARGVKVRVLLDKSNLSDKYSKMQQMIDSGIDVSIDKVSGIAHNKVIILDESKIITGSFNFTKSADTRNAENVIIVNDKEVASKYLQNWFSRKAKNTK
jgi:phospholipase D|tara:strand:+ start:151 stop:777 length:627 start_codon:yes stop_codon:yes gene_type:complete